MLKKFLSIALCIAITFTLFACDGQQAIQSSENLSSGDGGTKTSNTSKTVSLKAQIQNCKAVIDCSEDVIIDQMDTVTFGTDEKGKPIEWLVLEKNNNKALLLTKYLYSGEQYNKKSTNISWEDSDIRKFLNQEFIDKNFDENEKESIIITDVVNNDNAEYGTKGGNNTKDKVFLLSLNEVKKYLRNESLRNADTRYQDIDIDPTWWLRSPGETLRRASYVHGNGGSIVERGDDVICGYYIRPAMWVKY